MFMRRLLLTLGVFLAGFAGLTSSAESNKLFIVPADESGKIVKNADGTYAGQVEMIQDASNENEYSVKDVELPYPAFAIYGINEQTGLYSFYGTTGWAVTPLPANYPSPLIIAGEGMVLQLPADGRFDFELFDRDVEGIQYHMLLPIPSDGNNTVRFPSHLYLIDSSNKSVILQGDMSTGIYQGDVALAGQFRISYEPRYNQDAFIFGPTSAGATSVELHDGVKEPIAYAQGTTANFYADPAVGQKGATHVEVNLDQGYIVIGDSTPSALEEIGQDDAPKQYYTITGLSLSGEPEQSGMYIVKQGERYSKVVVRR